MVKFLKSLYNDLLKPLVWLYAMTWVLVLVNMPSTLAIGVGLVCAFALGWLAVVWLHRQIVRLANGILAHFKRWDDEDDTYGK